MEMKRVLLDTNVYSSFKRNDETVVDSLRHFDHIGIDATVYAELLSGFRFGSNETKNKRELETFLNSPRVFFYRHDETTAEFYAQVFMQLRRNGRPVPTNDIWIAACAMQNGLAVYTKDTHFMEIDGLFLIR
jgi:tRNA(fMet)-specific endonuclease VapC